MDKLSPDGNAGPGARKYGKEGSGVFVVEFEGWDMAATKPVRKEEKNVDQGDCVVVDKVAGEVVGEEMEGMSWRFQCHDCSVCVVDELEDARDADEVDDDVEALKNPANCAVRVCALVK